MAETPRSVAIDVLTAVRRKGSFAEQAFHRALAKAQLSPQDVALAAELSYGVLRNRMYLDYVIGKFVKKPGSVEPRVQDVMRLGTYQLLFLDRVPLHAAVNESVKLVPRRATGFTNAVLRKVTVFKDNPPAVDHKDPLEVLSISTSHPRWIIDHLVRRFGVDGTAALCEADQTPPPNVLRANKIRLDREELIAKLHAAGIEARPTQHAKQGVIVERLEPLLRGGWFERGDCVAQGEPGQLVGTLLGSEPGERVLDLCAAPGMKTMQLAAMVGKKGHVVACDVSPGRLQRLERNIKMLGAENVELVEADGTREFPADIERDFDRVLVDAPCSALGELAKHPDARYKKQPEDVAELAFKQKALLENAAGLVKSGGTLVYSTCTLTLEENEQVVEPFLKKHPEFFMAAAGDVLGPTCEAFVTRKGYFLSAPHITGASGFFAARMVKNS
jgi:16S rRNA (cytosine967-C5)-methyltransferase